MANQKRLISKRQKPRSNNDERVKVLLSIGADELRRIDARADAANMTRSAYIVEMILREEAGIVRVTEELRGELRRLVASLPRPRRSAVLVWL